MRIPSGLEIDRPLRQIFDSAQRERAIKAGPARRALVKLP
jgi:hypothetical protein